MTEVAVNSPTANQVEYERKLVHLANQIGKFFAHQPQPEAVASVADHLHKYWDPRMRTQILAHLAHGGEGLDDLPRQAIEKLAAETPKQ
jgi:formate dehydrogenase subunit delta